MQRINKIQSDGFNPDNQIERTNTISSRETLEIRVELQNLYKNAVAENSEATNDSNRASTVRQTIENSNQTEMAEIRKGIENLIYKYPIQHANQTENFFKNSKKVNQILLKLYMKNRMKIINTRHLIGMKINQ